MARQRVIEGRMVDADPVLVDSPVEGGRYGATFAYNKGAPWNEKQGQEAGPVVAPLRGIGGGGGMGANGVSQAAPLPTPLVRITLRGTQAAEYVDIPRFRTDLGTPMPAIRSGRYTTQTHMGTFSLRSTADAPTGRQEPSPLTSPLQLRVVPQLLEQPQNLKGAPPACP